MSSDEDTVALGKATEPERAPRDTGRIPVRTRLADRYEIVDFLGMGGMGAVYLAIDEALHGKPVALKVVAHDVAHDDELAELRQEVLLAQQVTHRNVCRIYDLEQIDGRWMVKMECISGETLAARLQRGSLTVTQAVEVARQIAEGLSAAHEQGVIHRDLKPGNVMIEQGTHRVVLMDFGIARPIGQTSVDRSGTPAYMSPEQLRGERADPRSDVYALGCLLYHMLAGEVVFPATTPQVIELRHLEDAAPDLRVKRPDVPAWLARLIGEMLAKDPAKRPPDAAAVLRRLSDGPPRRGLAIAVTIAAAAAIAAVAVLLIERAAPTTRPSWQAEIHELEPSYDENGDSVGFSPDGTRLAYSTDRETPNWFRVRVRPVGGVADDVAITPPEMNAIMVTWSSDGQSLLFTDVAHGMVGYRVPASGGTPEKIGDGYVTDCAGRLLRFEFSSPTCPSCPRFVLRSADGSERDVLQLDSNAFVTTYRCDRAGTRVVWSRAEQGAPFYQPSDLWIADLATGTARPLTRDRKRNAYPTFTPDGKDVVFSSARGGGVMNLWEMPADGSGEPRQLTSGSGNDLLPDVSPDGTQLVFDVDASAAPLFAHGPDGATRRVTPSRAILVDPQITPDGKQVVAADFAPLVSRIVAIDLADGSLRPLADGAIASVTPDGTRVVFAGDGAPSAISVVPLAGGAPALLGHLDGRVRALRVGPDGAIHAMVDRGSALEAWSLPLTGGAPRREADAPWCFVQPAPAGGWTMWMRCNGDAPSDGVLVPPGEQPTPADPQVGMPGPIFAGGEFTADGLAFIAYDQPKVVRIDLRTRQVTQLYAVPLFGLTVSPDGATVYSSEAVGRARRDVITNFADRPRP